MTANILSTSCEVTAQATGSSRGALHAVHHSRQPTGRTGPQPQEACAASPRSGPGRESAGLEQYVPGGADLPCRCRLDPVPTHVDARPREVRWQGARTTKPQSIQICTHRGRSTNQLNLAGCIASSIRFPFNGFTYFLTLFPKSFSSFPHGTCSLSVSCQYLALDGVYHPFWAAFPNNPTLRKHIVSGRLRHRRGCHPL